MLIRDWLASDLEGVEPDRTEASLDLIMLAMLRSESVTP